MKKRSNLVKKVKSIRWRKEYKMPLIAAGMVATAALIAFVTTSATYSGASSGSIVKSIFVCKFILSVK